MLTVSHASKIMSYDLAMLWLFDVSEDWLLKNC